MQDLNDRPLVTTRTMEMAVASVFFLFGAVCAWDSWTLGAGWGYDGPQSGYFPFYLSVIICISSAVVFFNGMRDKEAATETYVTRGQFKLVLQVLIPAVLYTIAISFFGIYVSSTVFVILFMMLLGKYALWKAAAVGFGMSIVFYLLFEVWFHVPLPKGPLEAMLGLD